jgi:hypothetical protein
MARWESMCPARSSFGAGMARPIEGLPHSVPCGSRSKMACFGVQVATYRATGPALTMHELQVSAAQIGSMRSQSIAQASQIAPWIFFVPFHNQPEALPQAEVLGRHVSRASTFASLMRR